MESKPPVIPAGWELIERRDFSAPTDCGVEPGCPGAPIPAGAERVLVRTSLKGECELRFYRRKTVNAFGFPLALADRTDSFAEDIADAREELGAAGYPEGGLLFRLLDQLEAKRSVGFAPITEPEPGSKGEVDRRVAEELKKSPSREVLDRAWGYLKAGLSIEGKQWIWREPGSKTPRQAVEEAIATAVAEVAEERVRQGWWDALSADRDALTPTADPSELPDVGSLLREHATTSYSALHDVMAKVAAANRAPLSTDRSARFPEGHLDDLIQGEIEKLDDEDWHLTSRGDYPQEDGDYLVVFEDGDEEVMRVFFWSQCRVTENGFRPQAGWTTDESWNWHETPVTAWRRRPAGPGGRA